MMGFDSEFIPGFTVTLPSLSSRVRARAFNAGLPLEHTRFSIIFNAFRGFAIATAHNIDGDSIIAEGTISRRNNFRLDRTIPRELQVDNDRGYRNNPWDRGHLVRRRSLHWGDEDEARQADSESFFWTNIAPQHERLHDTAWGGIEDFMLELADDANKRASIFTGPVLTDDDPEIVNRPSEFPVQIPAGYWKILAIQHESELRAASFLVWQRDFDRNDPVEFDPILEQVRLTTIEFLTGLTFGDLRDADPLRFGVEFEDETAMRGVREGSALPRAAAITCCQDIVM